MPNFSAIVANGFSLLRIVQLLPFPRRLVQHRHTTGLAGNGDSGEGSLRIGMLRILAIRSVGIESEGDPCKRLRGTPGPAEPGASLLRQRAGSLLCS